MSSSRESDLNVLTEGLAHRTFQGDEQILDTPDFPAEVYILIGGSATLAAETPFGPHPVASLEAPVVVNLRRAFGGAPGLTRLQPSPGAAAAVLPSGEAHALLFDPSPRGQAFRRLALASIVTHVRETNDAMTKFFDSLTSRVKDTVRDSGGQILLFVPDLGALLGQQEAGAGGLLATALSRGELRCWLWRSGDDVRWALRAHEQRCCPLWPLWQRVPLRATLQ